MKNLSCAVPKLAAGMIAAAVVFAPVSAEAHYFMGGRLEMNYDYVYGSGGDSNSGGDRIDRTQLDGWDIDQLTYANSTQGAGYTAGVSVAINGWYSYTDFPTFTELTGAGYLDVAGEASGTGLALMNAGNRGSATTSSFTVTEESTYRLQGWVDVEPGEFGAGHLVTLQHFNGFFYETVFSSWSLPGGYGTFDVSGSLLPGDYRMYGQVVGRADNTESHRTSYEYYMTMSSVPEPATFAILLPGLYFLRRRGKR